MADHQNKNEKRKFSFSANWKKYVFEFLMVFFAITLGFFVENYRSSISDRELEIQHIQSLVEDLKQDTALFKSQIKETKAISTMCDSVILLLNASNRTARENRLLYFINRQITPKLFPFVLNQSTFDEMKSSGTFRLIHQRKLADSISQYYFLSSELTFLNNLIVDRAHKKLELEIRIFDNTVFEEMLDKKTFKFKMPSGDPRLIIQDRLLINEFEGVLHYISAVSVFGRRKIEFLDAKAKRLIPILQREYELH